MKKILIYDVAAESGGALSVLNKFYEEFTNIEEYESYFVVSVVNLNPCANVHIIKLPWVKKSWLHRLYCDYFYISRLLFLFQT